MNATSFPVERFSTIRTPFYYYDTTLLRQTLQTIREEIGHNPNYHLHYAVKANANPTLLRIISAAGFGADCVSGGEIKAAIQAGFPASGIVFAGVGKSDEEITLALNAGIACFNVESVPELEVINQLALQLHTTAPVALRINPNVGAHTHANITTGLAENKFGIAMEQMEDIIHLAQELPGITFKGLHFHIGSQILEMDDFVALCNRINDLQAQLAKHHITVGHINVGGGLGIDYHHPDQLPIPDFKSYFATYRKHLNLLPEQQLHFELGRALVAQCGSLITKVLYVKQATYKQFAIVDAGMTDLIRPALYQAFHHIQNLTSQEPCQTYDVVGPICESSDVFVKAFDINACRRGDLLAIRSAGAYGEIMASGYNCRPLPKAYTTEDLI